MGSLSQQQTRPSKVPEKLRTLVSVLGQVEPTRTLGTMVYRHVTRRCLRSLRAVALSVEKRPSFDGTISPGLSDIDFLFSLRTNDPDEQLRALVEARNQYLKLQKRYRLPGEVLAFTPALKTQFLEKPTPLGWYLGYHDRFPSVFSQIGLALQFYALAMDSLRRAIRAGQNSFHTYVFLREMRKAFAALTADRERTPPRGNAVEIVGHFLEEALEKTPTIPVQAAFPRLPDAAEKALIAHCRKGLLAPHVELSPSSLPYLLSVNLSGTALASAHVRYLRSGGLNSPLILLPPRLVGVLESGYCGWRKLGKTGLPQAQRERLLMDKPNLLGVLIYGTSAEIGRRLGELVSASERAARKDSATLQSQPVPGLMKAALEAIDLR